MLYYWVKTLHVSTVVFTIGFFALRFFWMLYKPGLVRKKWVRYLSVLNDTLLLGAGITLAIILHQYPLQSPWLTAKLVALLVYILLGMHALRLGKSKKSRTISALLALLTVGYIVLVALKRSPLL